MPPFLRIGWYDSSAGGGGAGPTAPEVKHNPDGFCTMVPLPRIAKLSAIFQYKIIIFQGQFSIGSAFSIETSPKRWQLYCNLQYRKSW